MTAVRKEVMSCIADIPDSKLEALIPILAILVDETVVIETDLTDNEKRIIKQGREEYKEGGFVALLLNSK